MPLYRCEVEGENFPLAFDGELGLHGFFVTRLVKAESHVEAKQLTLHFLRGDPALQPPEGSENGAPSIVLRSVELADPEDVEHGFIFYPMNR